MAFSGPSPTATLLGRDFSLSLDLPTITPVQISIDIPSITPFTFTPVHRTDCVTATPDANGYVPPEACNALWEYSPSMAAAVIFSVVFGILFVALIAQAVWFKKAFAWVIIVATSWELGSFVTRALAVHNQQSNPLAFVSQLLVLLAPLWINAFVYMVFARLIYFLLPTHRLHGIHASKVAFVFVWLDIISFFIQLIGSFIAAPGSPSDQITNGLHVYMGGIGIQECWILVVLALAATLWVEVRRIECTGRHALPAHWRRMLIVVYATLVLITVRVIFRLVEFSGGEGTSNPLPFHEAYFLVFDASVMALAVLLLVVVSPFAFLQGPYSEFPSLKRAEKKEVKRLRKEAQAAAKARGMGWWQRWRLGRHVKRQETERIAAAKWAAPAVSEKLLSDNSTGF